MLAAGAVLTLCQVAGARLLAYHDVSEVRRYLESWEQVGWIPAERELNQAFAKAYGAADLERSNPEHLYLLGSLHLWRQHEVRLWPGQALAEGDKAVKSLKSALALRPGWSDAWVLLAVVKYRLGQIDEAFRFAVMKSIETGRYETSVHHGIALTALRAWSVFTEREQSEILGTMLTALRNDRVNRFVVEQMVASGWYGNIEDKVLLDDRLRSYAERFSDEQGISF